MKTFNKYYKIIILLLVFSSCSEDFINRPPESDIALSEFYSTEDQVDASTNILYGLPWYQYNNFFSWCVGDIASGNLITWDPKSVAFVTWDVEGDNQVLTQGWTSLWGVIAQANSVINYLPEYVDPQVPQEAINNALGEARFMRGLAYFYLVRIWGNVPIIENNLDHVYDSKIPTNPVSDIYKFIKMDFEFAINNLKEKGIADVGHAYAGTARAFLAKVYLYEKNYEMAKQLSGKVISDGDFILLDNYYDLFLTENDNNDESVLQLQWVGDGAYGTGNALQAYFAHSSSVTGTGDGWGAVGPSIDLLNAYEDDDTRDHATVMRRGDYYSDLNGGFTVPDDIDVHGADAGIKKYVVGRPEYNGGGSQANHANNTYLMRYADVLLIYAEAIMAGSGSTSDAQALNAYKQVRQRAFPEADLSGITEITFDDILYERRIEFAVENDFWYDLGRIDRTKAINIMANQERGTYDSTDPTQINPREGFRTPTNEDFLFPIPNVDVIKNPKLLEDPVPYNFN